MFSTIEINISLDDELSALLADYAAYIGDSGAFVVETPVVTLPDALLPDVTLPDATQPDATLPDATLPDAAQPDATLTPAVTSDPGLVLDPMATADTVVFTGDTAPAVGDAGVAADPTTAPATDLPPTDVFGDAAVAPTLDGLSLPDVFDLDFTILEVGRGFGQFGFTDLP